METTEYQKNSKKTTDKKKKKDKSIFISERDRIDNGTMDFKVEVPEKRSDSIVLG
jgi:hypothetical protein